MDRSAYDEKINNMLNDETTYKMLTKDPMKSCETKMKSLLSSKKIKIGDKLYKK